MIDLKRLAIPTTAVVVGCLVLGALLMTSHDYAMVWDEGHTVRRDRLLLNWLTMLAKGEEGRALAFRPAVVENAWPFGREEPDGHPSFYAIVGVAGWWASHRWLDPLTSYRFGPMVLDSLTMAILFAHLVVYRGKVAAVVGVGSLAMMPHVFSLSHYAHYDMPVTCLWLLTQMAFLKSINSPRWGIVFGIVYGLTLGTKFTGIFAIVPALSYVLIFEWLPRIRFSPPSSTHREDSPNPSLAGTRSILVAAILGVLTLYAIHPPWWSDPVGRIMRFLASNMTRAQTKPIPTMYLGEFYPYALPWHNTLVLTAVCVPVVTLVLGLAGGALVVARRLRDREGWLWVSSWATLMCIRALPMSPGHDGVRLFLPSIASLCVLAGLGAQSFVKCVRPRLRSPLAIVLTVGCLGESLIGITQLYPYTLSYFNMATGGLPGAKRAGLELTYYWDTMGPEFLAWVAQEARERDLELRFPSVLVNIPYLKEWGMFPGKVGVIGLDPQVDEPDYVLQMRRGHFYPYDWWLDQSGTPSFRISRQGVDLLRVYPHSESFKAFLKTRGQPTPAHLRN